MQEAAIGAPVAPAPDYANLRRGDLLFWVGHVAIVRNRGSLIHANAFHMAVAIEPVAQAVARIREAGLEVTSARRMGG
jgi:cell wall-associated NlpC family hydrolase